MLQLVVGNSVYALDYTVVVEIVMIDGIYMLTRQRTI